MSISIVEFDDDSSNSSSAINHMVVAINSLSVIVNSIAEDIRKIKTQNALLLKKNKDDKIPDKKLPLKCLADWESLNNHIRENNGKSTRLDRMVCN